MKLFKKILIDTFGNDNILEACEKYEQFFDKAGIDINSIDLEIGYYDLLNEYDIEFFLGVTFVEQLIDDGWFTAKVEIDGFEFRGTESEYNLTEEESSNPKFMDALRADVYKINQKTGYKITLI